MKKGGTQKLIDSLVAKAQPVADRSSMVKPLFAWIAIIVGLVVVSFAAAELLMPEKEWDFYLWNPALLFALLPAIPAGIWVIALSLPGRRTKPYQIATILFFTLWGGYLLFDLIQTDTIVDAVMATQKNRCIFDILLIGALPLLFLLIIVRTRFVLNRETSMIAIFLSSSLAAAACTGILCKDHSSLHVFQEHYLPVTVLLMILILVRRHIPSAKEASP